ncbi:low-density lipoprotein receptor-related protein 4-like [Phymastichus coffea]|uniref:low-density lipoprotein receptor-related protein 4-like n=1 Tax=Phymastichus coffea TaxID=108790 RepID=UPI00273CC3E0|nr:low-density lipoprotein receptor-related protein 4-like [Phymastichus coffea]
MSATADELYWINAAYYNSGVAFTDGSVYKCDLAKDAGRCLPNTTRKLHESFGTAYVRAVRAVAPPLGELAPTSAGCAAGCQHLCLRSSCRCAVGQRGAERCRPVDEFVVYEDSKVVRSICLPAEDSSRCQAFVPFLAGLRLRKTERTGFDYDSLTRELYYGGKNAIYRADLDTGNSTILLYQRAVFFGPLALDWMTKNLYYTEIEQRGNVSFYILKVLSARPDVDAEKSSSMLWELGKIHTMATCPWKGYLFLSVFHNGAGRFHMRRINVDGTDMTILAGLNDTTFFSIDHPNEKLYTINNVTSMLVRSDFDGQQIENVSLVEGVADVTGFLVNDRVIYLKYRSRMIKLDKQTGKSLGEVDLEPYDSDMSMNLKLHNATMFGIYDANPCATGNGGCDNFCFALSGKDGSGLKKICRCFDGVVCHGDTRSGMELAEIIKNKM